MDMTRKRATERLHAIPADPDTSATLVPSNLEGIETGLEGLVLVSEAMARRAPQDRGSTAVYDVIPDGNRSALIPSLSVELEGRRNMVSVKGVGARASMYTEGADGMLDEAFTEGAVFTSESWYGLSPWGAIGVLPCLEAKALTESIGRNGIEGFHICPMVRATPIPEWIVEDAMERFWFRRMTERGQYYQMVRLLPSDVRLFYESDLTLGRGPLAVLTGFGVDTLEGIDTFIDNYTRSGMAALTLIARTIKIQESWGHQALVYDDVWLDKDAVVAPDGTLFFADIEGLDWVPMIDEPEIRYHITRQFDRNFYEYMYGLDLLLHARDRFTGKATDREVRRQEVAFRFAVALQNDPYVHLEEEKEVLRIFIRPRTGPVGEVGIKLLDLVASKATTNGPEPMNVLDLDEETRGDAQ